MWIKVKEDMEIDGTKLSAGTVANVPGTIAAHLIDAGQAEKAKNPARGEDQGVLPEVIAEAQAEPTDGVKKAPRRKR